MRYLVITKWTNGKETRYVAPDASNTPTNAVFNVATLWHMDFAKADNKNHVTDVTVEEIPDAG